MKPVAQLLAAGAVIGGLLGLAYYLDNYINAYIVRIIVNAGIAIILSLSLNLINGCAGQFSLGHAGFMGVGAYTSAALTTVFVSSMPFFGMPGGALVAVIIGGLAAAFAGYLVGLPSLRLRGDYLAIVTLGFGEIIRIILLNMDVVGGARGLSAIPNKATFFEVYAMAFLTFLLLFRLLKSSYGRAILSVREDEIAAEAMGIDVSKYKIVAFVISSFFAGIAGALYAHFQGFIDPNSFNFNRSVEVVIMVVIGGMGSLSGAVLGAVIVTILPEWLRVFGEYRLVIFPALLIICMLVRPMGIFGRHEIWDLLKKKPRKPEKLVPAQIA